MAINTTQIRDLLRPGLAAVFGDYPMYPGQWSEIFEKHTSDKAVEIEVEVKLLGLAQIKAEGASTAYQGMGQRYVTNYVNRYTSVGFIITRQAIKDNLYQSSFPLQAKALRQSMEQTKEVLGASVLNNGFNAAYTGGDGVALFSTAHPLTSGGTNSNTQSTAADLNETSLEAAVIQIAAWTDERGLLIAAKPRKLIVPPSLMFVAKRLLDTELRVGTTDNDINALKAMGSIPEGYKVNHFLTDANAYFLMTDVPNGLKHFVRSPLANSMDGDFDTGNVRYKARERYSFGWSDPLGVWGSPGT